ncbi:MAG TPA: HAMP domain-containing sensor histidine kinase [Candidatus Limnocylindrales bacterium]
MKRLTIRARLTLLYTGLFTAASAAFFGVTYVLMGQSLGTPLMAGSFIGSTGTAPPPHVIEDQTKQLVGGVRRDALDTLLTQGSIAFVVILACAAAFSWLIAGRALKPLQQITDTAARIAESGRGLHERIALDGPRDEVKRLADTFDKMLARLDHSFDGQKRFVANASHELRTPLALNRALVELTITREGASHDAQQLGDALLKVNERHERLIDGLLMLADSETEITERSPVDLAEVAGHVLDALPSGAPRVTRLLEGARLTGDPILLERLVQNLVENAVKYNLPRDGWINVATSTVDGRARLTVINPGPVVPGYEVETIFQPFRRLGRERAGSLATRGLGLGLSIVRAIANAHGGKAGAVPRPGGGLIITVTI